MGVQMVNRKFWWLLGLMFLAGALNGTMDTIDFQWDRSVFKDIQNEDIRNWFKSDASDKFKEWHGIKLHPIFWDGWHFFKQAMVIVFILALAFVDWEVPLNLKNILLCYLIFGLAWWAGFTFLYNVLLVY